MNILYINTPTYIGGAEKSLLTLMSNLTPERYKPLLITSGAGQFASWAHEHNIATLFQQFPQFSRRKPWLYLKTAYQFTRTVIRQKIALMHVNCPKATPYVGLASRLTGTPYVVHVRDYRHAWSRPDRIKFLSGAKFIIANSNDVAKYFVGLGVPESFVRIIYNPIHLPDNSEMLTEAENLQMRQSLHVPVDVLLVGIIGQIQEIKGHEDVVNAAPMILERNPDVHFLIAGAAFDEEARKYEAQLKDQIRRLQLSDHFHFVGFRNDVLSVMQTLDMLVVPSWREPFGRVVVEAMGVGCPVIGTKVGGIPEIIEDGINGLLVQPQNPVEIAQAVMTLSQDLDLRETLINQGYNTAQRFNVGAHVSKIQHLYDVVLEASRHRL